MTLTSRRIALTLLISTVLLAPLGVAWAAEPVEDLIVPEGTTVKIASTVQLRNLDVRGTLVVSLPQGFAIDALRVRVGPEGVIEAPHGEDGTDARGLDATGTPGSDGGSVFLRTQALLVEKGGRIEAGDAGHGGDAEGHGVVTGGAGGSGGSVVIEADAVQIVGLLIPGSGGAGGHAIQAISDGSIVLDEDAKAVGGRGGDTGRTLLNGVPTPLGAPAVSVPGFAPTMDPAYIDACPFMIHPVVGTPGVAGGIGGNACMIFIGNAGNNGAGCGNAGQPGQSATAVAIAGAGGNGLTGDGGAGGRAWAGARGGRGGSGGDCPLAFQAGGSGSSGAGATAQATGGAGGAASLFGGNGGHGGCAKTMAKGGMGGYGGNATNPSGGAGGAGGSGGAAKSTAVGGAGGGASGAPGDAGGNGGCAFVWSEGGDGGPGGSGNPNGGVGGNGAAITIADATGGRGGAGDVPGTGGSTMTTVDPEGGPGGFPNGLGGRGGDWAVVSAGGMGGTGCNGNPGGQGGTAQNEVPAGTGSGGVGGNGEFNNNLGNGRAIMDLALPGPMGASGGPECLFLGGGIPATPALSTMGLMLMGGVLIGVGTVFARRRKP